MINVLRVCEIFHSIQGETSLSGLPFIFIRLAGCNLGCSYCDSKFAREEGTELSINEIIEKIQIYKTEQVLITGGEPLIQKETPALVNALIEAGYRVSIETNGETPIQEVSKIARIVMDIKTPSSGVDAFKYKKNLKHLKTSDEVKFIIGTDGDYKFAKQIVQSGELPVKEILFSPLSASSAISPSSLAKKILDDHLQVRLQLQLHKMIWGSNTRGV